MNRKILKLSLSIILIVFSAFQSIGQIGSPYSQFGIGDLNHQTFGAYNAMGGIGYALKSNTHLNILNPASLSSIDSLTVLYELGVSGSTNLIKTNLGSSRKFGTSVDHIAMGFRLHKRFATSFGVIPASKVDYTFVNSYEDDYMGQIDNYFHGNGGLSNVFWSNSYVPFKGLSLGIEAKFLFGSINNIQTIVFYDEQNSSNTTNLKIDEQKSMHGFKFKAGFQYQIDFKKDYHLTLGAIYEHTAKINAEVDTLAGTISDVKTIDDNTYYRNFYVDDMDIESVYVSSSSKTLSLPSTIGFGLSLHKPHLLTYGFDVKIENWSTIDQSEYNTPFSNALSVRTGAEYTPDYDNISYYLKRIQYRLGGHYIKSYYSLNGTQIEDFGISFGLGLPLRNTKTSFNLIFEYGKRGTLDKNLLLETYGIVSLNLSLSDIWFVKRKFN